MTDWGDVNLRFLGFVYVVQFDHSIKMALKPFCHQTNPLITLTSYIHLLSVSVLGMGKLGIKCTKKETL